MHSPRAVADRQALELEASSPCLVSSNESLLAVLVRNPLDNALRYSPAGALVPASAQAVDGNESGARSLQA